MTSRRGFLAAMAAAMALDPERLLWKRGAKLISIPNPRPKIPLYYSGSFSPFTREYIHRLSIYNPVSDSLSCIDTIEADASGIHRLFPHADFVHARAMLAGYRGVSVDDFGPVQSGDPRMR